MAVSALMPRSSFTILLIRLTGTCSSRASALMLIPRGSMKLVSQHFSRMNWWQFFGYRHAPSSVIVDDLDIPNVPSLVLPDEIDAR